MKGIGYPATKAALVARARGNGADAKVLRTLERLPDGEFAKPIEVSEAIGRLE